MSILKKTAKAKSTSTNTWDASFPSLTSAIDMAEKMKRFRGFAFSVVKLHTNEIKVWDEGRIHAKKALITETLYTTDNGVEFFLSSGDSYDGSSLEELFAFQAA